jgi:ABC-type glycerol-3-phosphate transport system substrate-binding protein
MKKRWLSLILAGVVVLSGCGNSVNDAGSASEESAGVSADANTDGASGAAADANTDGAAEAGAAADTGVAGEPIELTWWTYTADGTMPDDAREVLQRANEISAEKIGVTVNMIYKTTEQFDLDLQTGEYYDMAFSCDWCNDFDGNAGKGYYYDITDKIEAVAPELYKAVDPWWEIGTLNGRIYGVPMLKDLGAEVFFRMNSDYFEKEKGMTLPDEMSFADLEPYLKQYKEDHPDEYPYYLPGVGILGLFQVHERVVSKYLVIPYSKAGTPEGTKIIPVFDDEEYMDMLRLVHKWYELGYINPDAATTDEVPKSIQTPVRTGTAWTGFMGWSDPEAYGFNVKLVRFIGPNMSRSTQQGSLIAINAAAPEKNVDACLKYMELLYTDRQFRDTLAYGIEGKHFEYYEDTVIRTAEGNDHYMQDNFVTGPAISASVVSANKETLADPLQWEKVYKGYEIAQISDTHGFSFDPTNVEAEIAALDAIWSSYNAELVTGTVDTDEAVKEIRSQMEAAGLDKVREEAQRQLDEYLEKFN